MQLIGIGSDGASSMTGHLQGVITWIAKEFLNTKFYWVWCELHQLDLVLKHAYMELYDNKVVEIMKPFIQHLRVQPGLITQIKAKCPWLTTRWLIMGQVCNWFLAKWIDLFEYIELVEQLISSTPPQWW